MTRAISFYTILVIIFSYLVLFNEGNNINSNFVPCAIATWNFGSLALKACSTLLTEGQDAVFSVEKGINAVELDNEDQYFVGVGGYPNSDGVMELDAAIMDHQSNYGAVMGLRNITTPISVAKSIMEECPHNILIGEGALTWALQHNFKIENLLTNNIKQEYEEWKTSQSSLIDSKDSKHKHKQLDSGTITSEDSHDTIGLICLDQHGRLAAGTSTSGWKYKHPGRVGDSPLVGSGLYCDGDIGAAVATGDGEEVITHNYDNNNNNIINNNNNIINNNNNKIMRSCLSFLCVEYMRQGLSPNDACCKSIKRILSLNPPKSSLDKMHSQLVVGIIAMDKLGNIGAASTLDNNNIHRNNPYFPVSHWKKKQKFNKTDESEFSIIKANVNGII